MLKEKLPGCGLKATPHIESRVKTLKKRTMVISDMLTNGSGFAWDEEKKMIICEKLVIDTWVKGHPAAKGLLDRPFLHLDHLIEMFGKDRANGKGATTLAAGEEEMDTAIGVETEPEPPDIIDGMETRVPPAANVDQPPIKSSKTEGGLSRGLIQISSSIKLLVEGTMAHFEKVGDALTKKSASGDDVATEMQKIEGTSMAHSTIVGKAIAANAYLTKMFISLPKERLKDMVIEVLRQI